MKKYPYQNLSLENIKGERWEDIPGLEMYFKVSNYGRVKRLEYELTYSDGRIYVKPQKIIKPVMLEIHNNFKNDDLFFLQITATLFKRKYNFSIARLVFNCFVQPFKMDDTSIIILTKDGNGLNIKPSNLIMASNKDKQQRMYDLKRNKLPVLEGEARQRAIASMQLTNNKQVSQYSLEGKLIKEYESIAIAARETGISPSHISQRAKGIEFSAGGFLWRYGNAARIDLNPVLEKITERKKRNKEVFGKKVTQYKMNGERVAIFPTLNDAAKSTGIPGSEISKVIENKRASAGGFFWKKDYCEPFIDLSAHVYGEILRAKRRQRPIIQYSESGNMMRTFSSIKEAARAVGVNRTSISGALTGKQKTSAGYTWEYLKK
jgi:hypothetical protein